MENSNQWEQGGDCNKCRRKNYCSKPCKLVKQKQRAVMSALIASKMDEMSGGAYSKIMTSSVYGKFMD